jgi:hypothetical protein
MKTLYLYDSDKGWVLFEYDVLSDLAHEFSIRNIRIGNDCELGDGCKLGDSCELGDGCKLGYGCWLGYDCKLGYDCELGDGCKLGNDCKVKHTLCIHASRHTITYWGCDAIQIGCKQYTISKWLSNYEKIGRSNNYSDKEIEEYWMYIDMIKHIHESGALM